MTPQTPKPLARRRRIMARAFEMVCLSATLLSVVLLFILLGTVLSQGLGSLNWDLLTRLPSRLPERAGIKAAVLGSIWLIGLTTLISVPVGVGAAIYLEEYSREGRLRRLIQLNIANLAGVPSIVYGILGLGLFVRALALERSVLSGSLTLSLVILPVVILTAQEALRAVPMTIRHASYALGATRWQTTWHQVLPVSLPGILTGVILSVSRALGEAAPLVAVGAVAYVSFVPSGWRDAYTALPIQIFDWSQRPQREFHDLAAAAIIVLLAVLLCLNGIAVYLRQRYSKHIRW